MNRIYFVPASQTENTGDLLINKVVIQLMGKHGQIILEDSNTDEWFIKELKEAHELVLSEVTKRSLDKHLLPLLFKSKFTKDKIYLVLAPGHTSRKGKDAAYRLIKRSIQLFLMKMLGLRIMRLGFSIGPFDKINTIAESFHSKTYYFYGVRDNESLKVAMESNIRRPRLFPDLAWAYQPPVTNSNEERGQYVVLSFRSNSYGKVHQETYLIPYIERIKAILNAFAHLNLRVVISYQVEFDRAASFMLKDALAGDFDVEVIDKKLLLDEAANLYRQAYFILSNRLHVLLFALQCATISFPLIEEIDNKKIYNIWKDNQMDDTVLDIHAEAVENINRIEKGIKNADFVLAPFSKAREKNQQLIQQYLTSIFK